MFWIVGFFCLPQTSDDCHKIYEKKNHKHNLWHLCLWFFFLQRRQQQQQWWWSNYFGSQRVKWRNKKFQQTSWFYCFVWAFLLNKFKTILKRTDIIVIKVFLNFINIYLKPQSFYFIFFLKPFLNICWKSIFKTLENSFNNCSFIL